VTLEIWSAGASSPGRVGDMARRLEEQGWDGLALVDSQNLAPDPYVLLGLAAASTSRLGLATGVTNPVTRHPAAAATAAATVQAASGGRFVLGIGRGDSSLAHLGLAPASPPAFETYLSRLQGYLRGEEVPFTDDGAAPVSTLGLAGGPSASRIHWIGAAGSKVPVDVAATGPKVIRAAARHADRVTFAVGASVERLRWAMEVFLSERSNKPVGAYVPVIVNPSRDAARELIRGGVASFARFSVMHGQVVGPADEGSREALAEVHHAYDMNRHFTHGSPQSRGLPAEVIDQFGVAGPAAYCVERLSELVELGLTKLVLLGGGIGMDRDAHRLSQRLLTEEVLPKLR
jgi:5,10-methylenetetrahydromethanopterin reductase